MKSKIYGRPILAFLIISTLSICTGQLEAQSKKKKKDKKNTVEQVEKDKKKSKKKSIKELTKSSEKMEGLFTVYRDTVNGSTMMEIKEDQIGKEYIYFSQIADGVLEAGLFRGAFMDNKIFKIEKHYDKIEFVTQNTSFYFDPKSALSKSAEANISEGIMASLTIQNEENGKNVYLIKSDELFLNETFEQIKPPKNPKAPPTAFSLGNLDKDKTKIKSLHNYPNNLNINCHYVYSQTSVLNEGSAAVTDGRNVTIKVTHSLIALPDNEYQPRIDDPRVGYFFTKVTDMTSASPTPYRDLIHRWNLVKKDPGAPISEPVQPIVWWIENSTPVEFRETIKEAVLEWNKAFEKAGFKNAIEVNIQPDDADWDAGDIRYNVLRWTSSPKPPFGGYGPSFVNPRTGEILGADIMLEYVYHTNRVKYERLFTLASDRNEMPPLMHPKLQKNKHLHCSFGHKIQENTLFGNYMLMTRGMGSNDNEMKGMKLEAMKELIMHEVGHTLGLNHNMKASQLFSPEQLNDPSFIRGKCLTGSVMDYTTINVANDELKQGHYFSTTVGPYDKWAIQFGYTPVTTKKELDTILNKSTKPELIFGNDADDMRSPGKAIDPRVMTGDMSNDQISYAIKRMELVNTMMPKIKAKFSKDGQSYQELLQAFFILRSQYARAGDIISRFIGGVYVDRSMAGQNPDAKPYTPVSYKDQKRAMQTLDQYVFAPNAYEAPNDLYNYLAFQRRGFNFFKGPEDPKIHQQVLNYQKRILDHLLHPNTLQRITDSELYGNNYTLSEFMTDLNNAMFKADSNGSINSFRQNLQLEYINRLCEIVKNKKSNFTYTSQSMALYNLTTVTKGFTENSGDLLTKAHKNHIRTLISNTLENIK